MFYTVYIIINQKGSRYIGQTNNLEVRLDRHNNDRVKSTRNRGPWVLKYKEVFKTRRGAMLRETQLKRV